MKFSMLPQAAGLLKRMLNSICTSSIQGIELCWHDFMKYTFSIVTCQDTCERICLKLSIKQNTTKLYMLIWVWLTLMFTQESQGYEKARTCAVILL